MECEQCNYLRPVRRMPFLLTSTCERIDCKRRAGLLVTSCFRLFCRRVPPTTLGVLRRLCCCCLFCHGCPLAPSAGGRWVEPAVWRPPVDQPRQLLPMSPTLPTGTSVLNALFPGWRVLLKIRVLTVLVPS